MLAETTVAELMTPAPITVKEKTRLHVAVAEMERSDIRHLPVLDAGGRLVGILSDRDVLRWSGSGGGDAHVEDIMVREVLTVRPSTFAREATGMMLDYKIGALPVVDENEQLAGILTETDFLRLAHRFLGGTL